MRLKCDVRIKHGKEDATGHPCILATAEMEEWSRCYLDTRPPSALERSSVDKERDSSDKSCSNNCTNSTTKVVPIIETVLEG